MASDHVDEAFRLVERAGSERERLRALEAVRAALDLELRDFARARIALKHPTDEQLAQLERNVVDAQAAYERVAGGSFDNALRALQGLRSALSSLRAATAAEPPDDPVEISLAYVSGDPSVATWTSSRQSFFDFHKIPAEFRDPRFRVRVQLVLVGDPGVTIFDEAGQVVWERPATDRTPKPGPYVDRDLLAELPLPNGHGA